MNENWNTNTANTGHITPDELAARWQLKPQPNGNWSGPHPTDKAQASKDGFTLFPEGNAITNGGEKYTPRQVAELAGIKPDEYAPFANWKARNGHSQPNGNGTAPNRPQSPKNGTRAGVPFDWSRAQTFDYQDEGGQLLFQVGRIGDGAAKQIRQRRPDGRDGWNYSLGDVRRVLWRLPEVREAQFVLLCEGEKAAAVLNAGFEREGVFGEYVATTNAQGAGKWSDTFCESLEGATVGMLPDNDEPGDKHGDTVCASIHASGAATSLCRIDLPGLPAKGDVCDWLEAGNTVADLLELFERAPQWEPEPEPEKERRFKFKTLDVLDAEPDPEWLIHGFLTEGGTSLLTAKHASYKSFFALEMALCVACDFPFHGHEIRAGRIVYIAAEGASGIKKRARAWCEHHGQHPGENFVVLDVPLRIHEEETRALFIEEVKALEPVLIVFDTLARCAVGLDESSPGDMGLFTDATGALARVTGAHILTVHHNNKNGDYRGSTALPAAVDTHITLSKGEGKNAAVTLEMPKQKDFEALYPITFEPRVVEFQRGGKTISSLIFEKGENATGTSQAERKDTPNAEQKVFEALEAVATSDGATSGMWKAAASTAGVSNGAFYMAVKTLTTSTNGNPARVILTSGETGGKGSKAPKYALSCSNAPMLQNAPIGALEETGKPSCSNAPMLHSPVGSGAEWSIGATAEEETKPKPRTPKKRAVSNSEPYAAPEPDSAESGATGLFAGADETDGEAGSDAQ